MKGRALAPEELANEKMCILYGIHDAFRELRTSRDHY